MDWPSVVIEEDPGEDWEDPGEAEEDPKEVWEDPGEAEEDPREVEEDPGDTEEEPREDGEDPREDGEDPGEDWEDPAEDREDSGEAEDDPWDDEEDPEEVEMVYGGNVMEGPGEVWEDPNIVGEDTSSVVVFVQISVINVDGLEPGVPGVDEWVPGGGASHSDQLGVVSGSVGSKQYWVWDGSAILMYTHESFLEREMRMLKKILSLPK